MNQNFNYQPEYKVDSAPATGFLLYTILTIIYQRMHFFFFYRTPL